MIEGIFLLIPSQIWSHWVDYSRNEADLKSSISWDPSFWLLQCEPSRRHGRARCDKKWAVESCSSDIIPRHHPQTSSTTSWRQQGAMESSTGFASDIRCVQGRNILCSLLVVSQTNLVSLYGNPGAPHRAPSTQRILCPRSFLTDFCALCPRALLTPRILTGLSKLQPNSRAGSSMRSPGCCGWLCVFISILISSMTLGWSEGLWGCLGNLLLNSVMSASFQSHFGPPSSALLFL